jgi:glycosyltransferase involved in cell wall biosynthesis
MDKKVSVLIITYNHKKYITQAVESALQQEVDFHEIVIGDDCSTDHTQEILK